MPEPSERMNDGRGPAALERQLQSLEPLPPQIDRDALMYQAGWAAALAQQPAMRRDWLAPALGGALAATAAGILALALWQSPLTHQSHDGIAQTSTSAVVLEPSRERDVDVNRETTPPATSIEKASQAPNTSGDRSLAAGESLQPVNGRDPWALVSTALVQRHGMRWDENRQREREAERATIVSPPPTVLQMMREAGALSDRRDTAEAQHPLLRLIEAS